jgi:hypothetical protein
MVKASDLDQEPDRRKTIYVEPSGEWLVVDHKFGEIPPPLIEFHIPMVGRKVYYLAESYRLPVPEAAQAAAR